jgi:hypothetical protein
MAPRRRIEGPVEDTVRALSIEHPDWAPAQIHREVLARNKGQPVVSLRTVQRIATDQRRDRNAAEFWDLFSGPPEDAAEVLKVLHAYVSGVSGHRRPTLAEADFVVRVRRAFPGIKPINLAFLSAVATSGPRALREVEEYLAFEPWEDNGDRLKAAVVEGEISPAWFWPQEWKEGHL